MTDDNLKNLARKCRLKLQAENLTHGHIEPVEKILIRYFKLAISSSICEEHRKVMDMIRDCPIFED